MKLIKRAERKNNIIGEAILMPVPEGVIPVDTWVPDEEDNIVGYAGKTLIVPFDKIFDRNTIESVNVFDISLKEAYYKQLDVISLYINYFLKFYDPDKELIMAYLKLKHMIDVADSKDIKRESMIKFINKWLFTDSICKKIAKMSQDNYRVDLTTEIQKKHKSSRKEYPAALQFNEHHAEILMRVSVAIKFVIPIVLHYIKVFRGKKEAKNCLYCYYMPLFKNKILTEDVNILGKLRHTISTRVNSYSKPDRSIYGRHEALGSSVETFIEDLFHKNLITDTVFSYRYNGNIISYNSVVLRYQLAFHSKEDLKMDFLTVSTEKEPEGLSGLDKMEMYTTKIDSFLLLFSNVNIQDTIKRIRGRIKMTISQEEIDFYLNNHDFNNTSKELLFYFYAKYFGGFRDLNFVKRVDYVTLMIIMKRMLEADGDKYINQIVSANVKGKSSARVIRNAKFLEKITTSSVYQKLMEKKYSALKDEKNSPVIALLSRIINTNWTIVDYDIPEHLGEPFELNNDTLSEEFLRFVDNI